MSMLEHLHEPNPVGMTPQQRADRAAEDRRVATALRERAGVLYAACDGHAARVIAELEWFAQALTQSAHTYQDQGVY